MSYPEGYAKELVLKHRLGIGEFPFVKATKCHPLAFKESCAEVDRLRAELAVSQERVAGLEEALHGLLEGGKKFRANERSCGLIVYVGDENKARAALAGAEKENK